MRRAALRAAVSASRAVSTKPQVLGMAASFVAPPAARIAVPAIIRCFSQTLRVAEEADRSNSAFTSQEEPGYGLFIRNMVFEAGEEHLRTAYEKYGTIEKVAIARDARGLSRGYGFVWFSKESERDAAVAGTDNSFWHGRRIAVTNRNPPTEKRKPARTGNDMGPTRSLYIGNIPYETTDAELNRIFKDLDNVKDVRVAVDRTTGWPRGFAHADFSDIESATKAKEALTDFTLSGRKLRVDFATESSVLRNSSPSSSSSTFNDSS